MDPEQPSINISDVVLSTTGRDNGKMFYVIGIEDGTFFWRTERTGLWISQSVKSRSTYKRSFALRPESRQSY